MASPPGALIVGMGCLLPGQIYNNDDLLAFLAAKRSAVGPLPADRYGGDEELAKTKLAVAHIDNIATTFDYRFFRSPARTEPIDPMQMMALQVVYEALQDSGVGPLSLAGEEVGVFCGVGLPENAVLQGSTSAPRKQGMMGVYPALIANRVSITFNWHGPSITIDTACASSASALDIALAALAAGSCTMAVVVGTNTLCSPWMLRAINDAGPLSPTGTSAPFDARGDGFCRAEGAAALVLVREDAAKGRWPGGMPPPERLRAYARIAGAGSSHDGLKINISKPSAAEQQRLITSVHQRCGVPVEVVVCVEAHATGTSAGDPVEALSVSKAFNCPGIEPRFAISTLKGNIGHLEAASGVAAVAKAALSLHYGVLLPGVGFQKWRSNLNPEEMGIRLVTEVEPLPIARDNSCPPCIGVNSYGVGGSNAYVILQAVNTSPSPTSCRLLTALTGITANPTLSGRRVAPAMPEAQAPPRMPCYMLPLALMTEAHLPTYPAAWRTFEERIAAAHGGNGGCDEALGALDSALRAHLQAATLDLPCRTALLGPLPALLKGTALTPVLKTTLRDPPRVGLVFNGQGAHAVGMGDDLWRHLPAFRSALISFATTYAGISGFDLLLPAEQHASVSGIPWSPTVAAALAQSDADVRIVLPASAAVGYSQLKLLLALGIKPAVALGHSAGEMLAGLATGGLKLRQYCALLHARCSALAALPPGGMLAVAASAEQVQAAINDAGLADSICIAAVNSPRHTTVSGCPEALQQLAATARLSSTPLRVRHAFHSPSVEAVTKIFTDTLAASGWPECGGCDGEEHDPTGGLVAKFLEEEDDGSTMQAEIRRMLSKASHSLLASTTTGAVAAPEALLDSAWWLANLCQPVQFAPAVAAIQGDVDILIEVGPTAVLGPCISATVPGKPLRGLATKPATALADTFEVVAQLWLGGSHVEFGRLVDPAPPGAPFPHKPWDSTRKAKAAKASAAAAPAGSVAGTATGPFPPAVAATTPPAPAPPAAVVTRATPLAPAAPTTTAIPAAPTAPAAPAAVHVAAAKAPARAPTMSAAAVGSAVAAPAAAPTAKGTLPQATGGILATVVPRAPPPQLATASVPLKIPNYFSDHEVKDRPMTPMAAWCCYFLKHLAGSEAANGRPITVSSPPLVLDHVKISRPHLLMSPSASNIRMEVTAGADSGAPARLAVFDHLNQKLVETLVGGAVADGSTPDSAAHLLALMAAVDEGKLQTKSINPAMFYRAVLQLTGVNYKKGFRSITGLTTGPAFSVCSLQLPPIMEAAAAPDAPDAPAVAGSFVGMIHPTLVDGLLQTPYSFVVPDKSMFALPRYIRRVTAWPEAILGRPGGSKFRAVSRVIRMGSLAMPDCSMSLLITSEAGAPLLLVEALESTAMPGPGSLAGKPNYKMLQTQWEKLTTWDNLTLRNLTPEQASQRVAWIGPAALVNAMVPPERRAVDVVMPDGAATAEAASAAVANAAAAGAVAFVLVNASLAVTGVALRAMPREASVIIVSAPGESMAAHKMCGFTKAAVIEIKRHILHLRFSGEMLEQPGGATSAGNAALYILAVTPREIEVVATPEGLFGPRYVSAQDLPPPVSRLPETPPVWIPGFDGSIELHEAPPPAPGSSAARTAARSAAAAQESAPPADAPPPHYMSAALAQIDMMASNDGTEPERWCLVVKKPGQLSSIGLAPFKMEQPLQPWEVEIEVASFALNFKDCLLALNMMPGFPIQLGCEVAGTIRAVGALVPRRHPELAIGAKVFSAFLPLVNDPPEDGSPSPLLPGLAATHVRVIADYVFTVPDGMPLVEAAGLGVVNFTSYYALVKRGQLRKGDTILIHSAMGGLGQSALRIAQKIGCRIIASAGDDAKRAALAATPGVVAVLNSRKIDAAAWRATVDSVTNGRGCDAALNGLASGGITATIACLAPGGKFLEVGKASMLRGESMNIAPLLHNISFLSCHIDLLMLDSPKEGMEIMKEAMDEVRSVPLSSLPRPMVFPMEQLHKAFRTMAGGKNIGKLVVTFPPRGTPLPESVLLRDEPPVMLPELILTAARRKQMEATMMEMGIDPEMVPFFTQYRAPSSSAALPWQQGSDIQYGTPASGAYTVYNGTVVISGGTSGAGAALVMHLLVSGAARHLLLLSSQGRGEMDSRTTKIMEQITRGGTVRVAKVDVRDAAAVREALASAQPPVEAIVHFAHIYANDSVLKPLEEDHITYQVKLHGALALHHASLGLPVRSFVLVSSIVRATGFTMSAAYAAANQGLAGVVAARAAAGLPGCIVDLPALAGAGRLASWDHVSEAIYVNRQIPPIQATLAADRISAVMAAGVPGHLYSIFPDAALTHEDIGHVPLFSHAPLVKRPAGASPLGPLFDLPCRYLGIGADITAPPRQFTMPAPAKAPAATAPVQAKQQQALRVDIQGQQEVVVEARAPLSPLVDHLTPLTPIPQTPTISVKAVAPVDAAPVAVAPVVAAPVAVAPVPVAPVAPPAPTVAAAAPGAGGAVIVAGASGGAGGGFNAMAGAMAAFRADKPIPTRAELRSAVETKLAQLMACEVEDLDDEQPLMEQGLDSLSAVELANWIQEEYGLQDLAAAVNAAQASEEQLTEEQMQKWSTITIDQMVDMLLEEITTGKMSAEIQAYKAAQDAGDEEAVAAMKAKAKAELASWEAGGGTPALAAPVAAAPAVAAVVLPAAVATAASATGPVAAPSWAAPTVAAPPLPAAPIPAAPASAVAAPVWNAPAPAVAKPSTPPPAPAAFAAQVMVAPVAPPAPTVAAAAPGAGGAVIVAGASGGAGGGFNAMAGAMAAFRADKPIPTRAELRSAVETKLAQLMACEVEDLDDEQPLMEQGLDSLSAVELANWIQEEYGLQDLAAAVNAAQASEEQLTEEQMQKWSTITIDQMVDMLLEEITTGKMSAEIQAYKAAQDAGDEEAVAAMKAKAKAELASWEAGGGTPALAAPVAAAPAVAAVVLPAAVATAASATGPVAAPSWAAPTVAAPPLPAAPIPAAPASAVAAPVWNAPAPAVAKPSTPLQGPVAPMAMALAAPIATPHPTSMPANLSAELEAALQRFDRTAEASNAAASAAAASAARATQAAESAAAALQAIAKSLQTGGLPAAARAPASQVASALAPSTATPPTSGARDCGIHALEVYFPANSVDLSAATVGSLIASRIAEWGQDEFCYVSGVEDAVSMAMTVLERLVVRHNIPWEAIGRLEVGTESAVDISKPIKSHLMSLFKRADGRKGGWDVEGGDVINGCYGATSALLNTLGWMESSGWDGRWGVVIATDVVTVSPALGVAATGAGAVAILVGPNAPVVIDPVRATLATHTYDVWKPLQSASNASISIDMRVATKAFKEANQGCHEALCKKMGWTHVLQDADYYVSHSTSWKWSNEAFEALCESLPGGPPSPQAMQELWDTKVKAGAMPQRRLGPLHNSAVWVALAALLSTEGPAAVGKSVAIFSYGSGQTATMMVAHVQAVPGGTSMEAAMAGRVSMPPTKFAYLTQQHKALMAGQVPEPGKAKGLLLPGSFYLSAIDTTGQRKYARMAGDVAPPTVPRPAGLFEWRSSGTPGTPGTPPRHAKPAAAGTPDLDAPCPTELSPEVPLTAEEMSELRAAAMAAAGASSNPMFAKAVVSKAFGTAAAHDEASPAPPAAASLSGTAVKGENGTSMDALTEKPRWWKRAATAGLCVRPSVRV